VSGDPEDCFGCSLMENKIERLEAELAQQASVACALFEALAGAEQLLREARDAIYELDHDCDRDTLINDIDAALAAPVARTQRDPP
jgi:hypothetical protein